MTDRRDPFDSGEDDFGDDGWDEDDREGGRQNGDLEGFGHPPERDDDAPGIDMSGEIAAATADLDDNADAILIPDSAPLTLEVVESILNARRPETQIHPTRDRMIALMDLLGNPQRAYPVIQVGGTNGKTSTVRMIDALLTRIGVRTGRFTSPHLQVVTERFGLDGAPIDAQRYADAYADIAPFVDLVDAASRRDGGIAMSKFEILTAMAFSMFADAPAEAAVIEVGLGGTWDSTNVADATVAVISAIGHDHADFLGPELTGIAEVKAGIIKPNSIAVIGRQQPEAMDRLLRRAIEMDATVARLGAEFDVLARDFAVGGQRLTIRGLGGIYNDIFLPLSGAHQADNAALALAAVEAFFGAGAGKQLDIDAIQDGFAAVSSPGRLERVRTSPTILVDAAHNPDGALALAQTITAEYSFRKLVGVLAVMTDKDVRGMLTALDAVFDEVVVTVNSSVRSMPVVDLTEIAAEILGEARVHTAPRMDAAIALAVDLAEADTDETGAAGTGVLITGSVVTAGDGRTLAGLAPA